MSFVTAICNHKGGVGKTTCATNLAAAIAASGRRVLVVDLDPQASATFCLGVEPAAGQRTVYESLLNDEVPLADAVVPAPAWRVDVVPASIELAEAEVELVTELDGERALRRALAPLRGAYDCVVVDCPPSLGPLTIAALTAADGLLVPVASDVFAIHAASMLLSRTVPKVRRRLNPDLRLLGILVTIHGRTAIARSILAQLREVFGADLLETVIGQRAAVGNAMTARSPLPPGLIGSGAEYRAAAAETLGRLGDLRAVA